ncbi:uncharacterized protein LACBIDRAFT_334009 [Laccaria bicolor S238N-H82]|uniref:Predicted protein n=1 Tax=Laccaria bicolor (strain S238N-H82 / ATCC MYA-4686) TaxID=486041 RepID=B0DXS8_LACBS|nr:uncharacterized protein LACBIDRAFT_334009 [Laccaria bicolor S238N-H82]EDR00518.1 predicted protein [Laccaria bicolor S238N-H82]|eukprot:XP_001888745.1 predicted protein [Laccaria bicolor S238N-H82]
MWLNMHKLMLCDSASNFWKLDSKAGHSALEPDNYRLIALECCLLKFMTLLVDRRLGSASEFHQWMAAEKKKPSWVGDIILVLSYLQVPVVLKPVHLADPDSIQELIAEVKVSCACTLQADINDSEKTILLKNLVTATGPVKLSDVLSYQHYLNVVMPGHCKVLTQLMTLCHTLAVNCLQWDSLWRRAIPQELRLCRFCHTEVEDDCHVMLYYITTTALTEKRGVFFSDAQRVLLGVRTAVLALPSPDLLRFLLGEKRVVGILAKYVFDVLGIFDAVECTISVADKMVKVSRAPPGLCCLSEAGCSSLGLLQNTSTLLYSTHDSNYATFTQCNTSGSDEYEGPHMYQNQCSPDMFALNL